jgi:hypothetical protein
VNVLVNYCYWQVPWVDCVRNVMPHAQKPDFVFRRNGRVHLNRRRRKFSRLLAAEVCASAVVMLDTPRSEVVWRVLATHSIRQFPLQFPSRASPCAITFQLDSTKTEFTTSVGTTKFGKVQWSLSALWRQKRGISCWYIVILNFDAGLRQVVSLTPRSPYLGK